MHKQHNDAIVTHQDKDTNLYSKPPKKLDDECSLLESKGVFVLPVQKSREKRTTAGKPAHKFSPADFEKKKSSKISQSEKFKASDKQILANNGNKSVFSNKEKELLYTFDMNANLKRMWNGANFSWANSVLTSILYSFDTIGFQMERPPTTDRSTWLFEHHLAELQHMKLGVQYNIRLMLDQVIRQYADDGAGNSVVNNSLLTDQQKCETLLQIFRPEDKEKNRTADRCPWDCLR